MGIKKQFQEALDICNAMHGNDWAVFKCIKRDRNKADLKVSYRFVSSESRESKFREWHAQELEVFVCVGVPDGDGQKSENFVSYWVVAVDIDTEIDIDWLKSSPLCPTYAVNTSGTRHHLVWILDQPIDPEGFDFLALGLAHRLGGDHIFANRTQAIRLPGFTNGKHGNEVLCSISLPDQSEARAAYDPERLVTGWDLNLVRAHLQARYPTFNNQLRIPRTIDSSDVLMDLEDALKHISSHDYDTWIKCLAALSKHGDSGYSLALAWSKKSSKFEVAMFERTWKSLLSGTTGREVSAASIFALASSQGWQNPGYRSKGEVTKTQLTERYLGEQLALNMKGRFAAIIVDANSNKQPFALFKWDGSAFRNLNAIEVRQEIENEVKILFGNDDKDGARRELAANVQQKIGTTASLDALALATMDFLHQRSSESIADKFPYFPAQNGVINLFSGDLVPSELKPLAQLSSNVIFDRCASAPTFERTLKEIFENDDEMVRFFLRLCGYVLMGCPKEHKFVIFHGVSGRNGKSLLVNVLLKVLGPFGCTLPTTAVMVKGTTTDGATPSIAKLVGKRLAVINEPNAKQHLDAGLVKQLTGGDRLTGRQLYGREQEFDMEATLLMPTNVLPKVREDDEALWSRILIVPFSRTFAPDEIDRDLPQKLAAETSGVLNMFIDGARDYLLSGLNIPVKCQRRIEEQRHEADPVARWLEVCSYSNVGAETSLAELHQSYQSYTRTDPDSRALSRMELSKRLADLFEKRHKRNCVYFRGVALIGPDVSDM